MKLLEVRRINTMPLLGTQIPESNLALHTLNELNEYGELKGSWLYGYLALHYVIDSNETERFFVSLIDLPVILNSVYEEQNIKQVSLQCKFLKDLDLVNGSDGNCYLLTPGESDNYIVTKEQKIASFSLIYNFDIIEEPKTFDLIFLRTKLNSALVTKKVIWLMSSDPATLKTQLEAGMLDALLNRLFHRVVTDFFITHQVLDQEIQDQLFEIATDLTKTTVDEIRAMKV